ncbi:MAG: CbtB domain-containing protein [Paracoccaceae bacterium]
MAATTARVGATASKRSDFAAILGVAMLGLGITLITGFAYPAILHDAAHDTRHAVGFPCH